MVGLALYACAGQLRIVPFHHCCSLPCVIDPATLAADNRQNIVEEGGIQPLIALMQSPNVEVQRQSTKAIANLAVNGA